MSDASQDRVDDIFGDDISGCRFGAEEYRDRSARPVAVFDMQVAVDRPQKVELLSLILMQALDLHVIDRFRIDLVALVLVEPVREFLLLRVLPVDNALQKSRILRVGKELLELLRVGLPAFADLFADQLGELGIALDDPSAESDPVGLVVELLGIELVEIVELCILKDLRVKSRHAVDRVAVVNVQMGHMHVAVPVDDLHGRIAVFCLNGVVHPRNDRHQVRNDSLQEVLGPCLQRLRQDRVVRVGADVRHDLIRLFLLAGTDGCR